MLDMHILTEQSLVIIVILIFLIYILMFILSKKKENTVYGFESQNLLFFPLVNDTFDQVYLRVCQYPETGC